MSKNIINQLVGGLSSITTITLPEAGASSPGEIVIFGPTANELVGSGIYSDSQKNVAAVNSVSFDANPSNPSGANAVWLSTNNKLYLGAEAIGPITLAPIGAVPNANGATLAAGVLNLQPASDTLGGVLTAGAQEIGGDKTFTEDIFAEKTIDLALTVDATIGVISMGGQPYIHSYADSDNTFLGTNSCIGNTPAPGGENTAIGNNSMTDMIYPAQGNTAVGSASLPNLTTGQANTSIGWSTMIACTTGSSNTALGIGTLNNVTTGSDNIGIGHSVGRSVTTASNTINIGRSFGSNTSGEINIGEPGTHTTCNVAGVAGVAPGGTPQAVIVNPTTGKLGSQALAAAVSFAAVGAVPNANGGSAASNVITLQPADATNPGVVTTGAQTFAGAKTFLSGITAPSISIPVAVGTPSALSVGSTPTMTVRGSVATTVPLTTSTIGSVISLTIANFNVTALTGAVPSVIGFALSLGAAYRPTFTQYLPIVFKNGGANTIGVFLVNTGGGINITLPSGGALTLPFGLPNDVTLSWQIV